MDLICSLPCQLSDHIIREFNPLGLSQQFLCQLLFFQSLLHFYQDSDLINKPDINFGNIMDSLIRNISSYRFCDTPDTHIIYDMKLFYQFFFCQLCKVIGHERIHMLLQRTDSLHQRSLKVIADTHDLSCSLHLGSQSPLGADKFVKGQSWDLYYAVIQHRLEAGICFAGNSIFDLIQGISQGNLCSHLSDRISCSLGSQGGRTGYTGIYLDNTVFKAVRVQGILHVTASGDPQLCDNVQSRSSQHLIFLVSQSLGRSHHDTVSCVNAYRVNIFHVADRDAVSCAVPHYFILDLFPSGNTALYQNFSHTGKTETVFQDLNKLFFIIGNTAAASSQGIGRTQYHRIADLITEGNTVFHIAHHQRRSDRLADLFHGILKFLAILGFLDRLRGGSDQTHIVLL